MLENHFPEVSTIESGDPVLPVVRPGGGIPVDMSSGEFWLFCKKCGYESGLKYN